MFRNNVHQNNKVEKIKFRLIVFVFFIFVAQAQAQLSLQICPEIDVSTLIKGEKNIFYGKISGGTQPYDTLWTVYKNGQFYDSASVKYYSFYALSTGTYDIVYQVTDNQNNVDSISYNIAVIDTPSCEIMGTVINDTIGVCGLYVKFDTADTVYVDSSNYNVITEIFPWGFDGYYTLIKGQRVKFSYEIRMPRYNIPCIGLFINPPPCKMTRAKIFCIKDEITDISEKNISQKDYMIVSPNPATAVVNINSSVIINELLIYDILGSIVFKRKLENNKAEINVSCLSKGVYLIKIATATGLIQQKFIKE